MSQEKREAEQLVVHVERVEDAPAAVARAHRARRAPNGDKTSGEEDFLSLRLLGDDRARLKRIVAHMLVANDLEDNESISYAGAARYAFRRLDEQLEAAGG